MTYILYSSSIILFVLHHTGELNISLNAALLPMILGFLYELFEYLRRDIKEIQKRHNILLHSAIIHKRLMIIFHLSIIIFYFLKVTGLTISWWWLGGWLLFIIIISAILDFAMDKEVK